MQFSDFVHQIVARIPSETRPDADAGPEAERRDSPHDFARYAFEMAEKGAWRQRFRRVPEIFGTYAPYSRCAPKDHPPNVMDVADGILERGRVPSNDDVGNVSSQLGPNPEDAGGHDREHDEQGRLMFLSKGRERRDGFVAVVFCFYEVFENADDVVQLRDVYGI
jgi:hypothetical protein